MFSLLSNWMAVNPVWTFLFLEWVRLFQEQPGPRQRNSLPGDLQLQDGTLVLSLGHCEVSHRSVAPLYLLGKTLTCSVLVELGNDTFLLSGYNRLKELE